MDSTFKIEQSDWLIILHDVEGDRVGDVTIQRAGGQNFHASMVTDTVTRPDGSESLPFRQLMFFEHDNGQDKVGDVVIQIRKHPRTGRYMIQVEQENAFENTKSKTKAWRATRSSLDNIVQAVKRSVTHVGWLYTNPRRIGGKPIKSHYVLVGWSPQLANSMMDVYDYVQTPDAMGLATLLKAFQVMGDDLAMEILAQILHPASRETDA